MTTIQELQLELQPFEPPVRTDARADMSVRLPAAVQPFLTWLTAKPAPCEAPKARTSTSYVVSAIVLTLGGCALSSLALPDLSIHRLLAWALLSTGLIATSSGLGLFQVGIFHHCAHGTVFKTQKRNRMVGRLISAILLFKYFDSYRHDHMLHHNAANLFTLEDEFTDFIVNICNFSSSLSRSELWIRLVILLISPVFHGKFLYKRICGSLWSPNSRHNLIGIAVWTALIWVSLFAHLFVMFVVAWVLPLSILLQVATVFRIVCEHRVPDMHILAQRGRTVVSYATSGVFAGAPLPARELSFGRAALVWTVWWINMLTVQLFVRIFVLVGDAPCHDFHHRRPARKWTSYIYARQADLDAGCPDYPVNYTETWGLFRAIDENFAALAAAPPDLTILSRYRRVAVKGLGK